MRLLSTITAFAVLLSSFAANADLAHRVPVQGKVSGVDACWDADPSVGACTCSMVEMANGRQYAISPMGTPASQCSYNTALTAFQKGSNFAFWDVGPIADRSCHFGNDNQPLHVIYSPSVWIGDK